MHHIFTVMSVLILYISVASAQISQSNSPIIIHYQIRYEHFSDSLSVWDLLCRV